MHLLYCYSSSESISLLKALAAKREINVGHTHWDIEKNVNPRKNDAKMRITENAWEAYSEMLYYSKTARYDGITDDETFEALKKVDYSYAIKKLAFFKKYIQGQLLS